MITRRRLFGAGALACLSSGMTITGCRATLPPDEGDSSAAIQRAIERIHQDGGGILRLAAGAVFRCRRAPIVMDRVTLDLNGSTLELMLTDVNDQGVRLRSDATLCNGRVRVLSRGTPSLQMGAHAPVCIGPLYGEGGTPSSPSPDEGVTGWAVHDLVLSSDKRVATAAGAIGAVAIQITGGAGHGLVERITIPDSETLSGAIHLDWGTLGPIVSADDPAGLQANRHAFEAGIGRTTHPHDITIRDIHVGRLTGGQGGPDGGADAIRLSGCCRIAVDRVRATATSGTFLRHTAGDMGLEFADLDNRKALLGNRFTDCVVEDCLDGRLFVSDSYADNLARGVARGYRSASTTLLPTDVSFEKVAGAGNGHAAGGVFVQQQGGSATRCRAERFAVGFLCDADTRTITLTDCIAQDNRDAGFLVEHVGSPPRDCRLIASVAIDNGAGQENGANIVVGASLGTIIDGGTIGAPAGRDTARYGIRIKERLDGCINAVITGDPFIRSHAIGGAAILVSSREGWGALRLFTGARYGSGVERHWVGLSVVPVSIDAAGHATYAVTGSAIPPASFPRRPGDVFRQEDGY